MSAVFWRNGDNTSEIRSNYIGNTSVVHTSMCRTHALEPRCVPYPLFRKTQTQWETLWRVIIVSHNNDDYIISSNLKLVMSLDMPVFPNDCWPNICATLTKNNYNHFILILTPSSLYGIYNPFLPPNQASPPEYMIHTSYITIEPTMLLFESLVRCFRHRM